MKPCLEPNCPVDTGHPSGYCGDHAAEWQRGKTRPPSPEAGSAGVVAWPELPKPYGWIDKKGELCHANGSDRVPPMDGWEPVYWAADVKAFLAECRAAALATPQAREGVERDARRYEWLKTRLFGADFHYSEPPVCALVFEIPDTMRVSANLDAAIDAAIAQGQGEE